VTLRVLGSVAWAMIGDWLIVNVVNIFFGDGIVAAPVNVVLPITNTSWIVPGFKPVREQLTVAQITVTDTST